MPLSFPLTENPRREDFSEDEADTNVSDPNDMGIINIRVTTTKVFRSFKMSFDLTDAQKVALLSFYDTDLSRVDPFLWTHPVSAEVITVKMVRRPQPSYLGYNAWIVAVQMQEA